jgi:hypothetical protein
VLSEIGEKSLIGDVADFGYSLVRDMVGSETSDDGPPLNADADDC